MRTPKDYLAEMQMDDDILFNRHEVSVWLSDFIKEVQVDSYNQAIEDSKLKIKYDFRETTVDTPTNNASYCSRSEMFMDFMSNYEDSILKLKIK